MDARTDWEELSRQVRRDRRRGKRLPLTFPIEVFGFDRTGLLFSERATTSNISELGCRFQINRQLNPGDVVAIKLVVSRTEQPAANKPLLFQIIWVTREGEAWVAGALKLQPDNIWGVGFPPDDNPNFSAA